MNSNLRIFVVDDDRDFAASLRFLLESEGHTVQVAHSGEEAVEVLGQETFDLTLLDVRMSGMNGVESFLEVRRQHPSARVMMMTAYSIEELLQQAIDAGALGVLRKPFSEADLLRTLEEVKPAGIVLVADDDVDFAYNLEVLLAERDYSVIRAKTGEEALERIANNRIDVLILDLRLPIMSGLEVYSQLRAKGQALPTVLVTAYAVEESERVAELRRMNIAGCFEKPFSPDELLSFLDDLLCKSHDSESDADH